MKKHLVAIAALAASLTAASGAYPQGRHDEKPHGMKKEAAAASEQARRQGTGGRHDEGPTSHAKKKASKKGSDQAADPGASK